MHETGHPRNSGGGRDCAASLIRPTEDFMSNQLGINPRRRRLALGGTLAAVLGFHPGVFAQAPSGSAAGEAQVLMGGVGLEERARLAEQGRGHNLKLVFTLSPGNFVGDVAFEILRAKTTVVQETSPGPWVFVKVPAGSYTVRATFEGRAQTRQVNVPGTGQTQVSFQWPATGQLESRTQEAR
jgi:hypothetical protein